MKHINRFKRKDNNFINFTGIKLATIFFALFFFACGSLNNNLPDEKKEQQRIVRYNIRKITEMVTFYHLEIPEKERINQIDEYDEKGLQIKSIAYGEDNNPERIMDYQYDENENLITITGLNPDSGLIFKETRTFDDDNNRIELTFLNPDGTFKYKNIASYDDGKMSELKWFWTNGPSAVNKYAYDEVNLVENSQYDPGGKFLNIWKHQYDKKNNLVESVQLSADSMQTYKIKYKYNIDNMLVEETSYHDGTMINRISFEYDRKALLLSKTHISRSGEVSGIYKYLYEYH